jgi:hypothetical protein
MPPGWEKQNGGIVSPQHARAPHFKPSHTLKHLTDHDVPEARPTVITLELVF